MSAPGFQFSCPSPIDERSRILLAHGGGGKLTRQLLERLILPTLGVESGAALHDAASLPPQRGRIAMTSDSFVVRPLFFPGGDIGSLSVHGTANDLAMAGASPRYLSVGLILEEGLPVETLSRVLRSMKSAADECGVRIVTGDTKVVERGKADGLYINTTGVGWLGDGVNIHPGRIQVDDAVIVSGDIGRHAMAVMAVREGLEFESAIESDSQWVFPGVQALFDKGIDIHCLRDLTRGGLASAVNELGDASEKQVEIVEADVPVERQTRAAAEMLGLDPLYLACEGRFVAFVPGDQADAAVEALRRTGRQANAARIGRVNARNAAAPAALVRSRLGVVRMLSMLSGEQLPRIC